MTRETDLLHSIGLKRSFIVLMAVLAALLMVIGCVPLASQSEIEPAALGQATIFPTPTPPISHSAGFYAVGNSVFNGVKTSLLGLMGPNQSTAFGDPFSNPASPFRLQYGHSGTYTFKIEIPPNYQGIVFDDGSNSTITTNIVRIELLDPDSYNQPLPIGAMLTHTKKFALELTANVTDTLAYPISEGDCVSSANQLHNPCIISTCEWGVQAGSGRCTDSNYNDYYSSETNPYTWDEINPHWYGRLDELRRPGGTTTDSQHETVTLYTLYYFKQTGNTIERVDLASYVGQSRDHNNMVAWGGNPIGPYHAGTDLQWVSPGAWNEIGSVPTRCQDQESSGNNGGFDVVGGGADGCIVTNVGDEDSLPTIQANSALMGRGFEIDLLNDVDGIMIDEQSQIRSLYLDVQTVEGASENSFAIWAGPPHAHYGFEADINTRNIQMVDEGDQYTTEGVLVYSMGVLPQNSLTGNRVDFPLMYIPAELAGERIEISLFDADAGVRYPMCFYFDTLPNPNCQSNFDQSANGYMVYYDELNDGFGGLDRCFPSCNNQFVNPPFFITVPNLTEECDPDASFEERMLTCNEFSGGRLMVSYNGG
ncbi:MAG: hypothetical protein AAF485_28475, partial [Chloroflexota bacterium]